MADHPASDASPPERCCRRYGVMRPVPVSSLFASSLPITAEETHKVLAALGPDLAAIFDEEA